MLFYGCAVVGLAIGWIACYVTMRGDHERELADVLADKAAADDAARLKDLELQQLQAGRYR